MFHGQNDHFHLGQGTDWRLAPLPFRAASLPAGSSAPGAPPGKEQRLGDVGKCGPYPPAPPQKKLEGYRLRMFKGFSRISVVDFYFRVQTWSLGLLVLWSMVCWIRWIGATNQDHLRWSSDLSAVILILSYLWKWLDQNRHIIRGKLLFEQMEKLKNGNTLKSASFYTIAIKHKLISITQIALGPAKKIVHAQQRKWNRRFWHSRIVPAVFRCFEEYIHIDFAPKDPKGDAFEAPVFGMLTNENYAIIRKNIFPLLT